MMDNRVRANQAIPKYRIYKGHLKSRGGRNIPRCWWKLAFMQVIITRIRTFEGALWALYLERQKIKNCGQTYKSYP